MKCFVFTCPLVCSFQAVSDIERNEWLDAIRIAILKGLDEERHVERGSVPSSHNILERICQNASNRTCADCNCDSECVKGGVAREGRNRWGRACTTHYTYERTYVFPHLLLTSVTLWGYPLSTLACGLYTPFPATPLAYIPICRQILFRAQVSLAILKRDWVCINAL